MGIEDEGEAVAGVELGVDAADPVIEAEMDLGVAPVEDSGAEVADDIPEVVAAPVEVKVVQT